MSVQDRGVPSESSAEKGLHNEKNYEAGLEGGHHKHEGDHGEYDVVQTPGQGVLSRELKGRHMQMIAIGMFILLELLNRSVALLRVNLAHLEQTPPTMAMVMVHDYGTGY